jgi:hypothetical protein
MPRIPLFLTSSFLTITSALAATSPTVPSTTGGSATPAGAGVGDGGLAQYWWVILIVLIAAAVLWYFLRRNERAT